MSAVPQLLRDNRVLYYLSTYNKLSPRLLPGTFQREASGLVW